MEVGEMEEEPANCGMLRHRTRSLPTVEMLQEELSRDTYITLERIMSECLNKIDNAADCSKGMQGGKVHEIRRNARMVQAGAYQLVSLIKKESGITIAEKKTQELHDEVATLRAEY